LHDLLEYAGRKTTGIDVEVYSGGQPSSGPGHIGSHRHDVGPNLMGAADLLMRDAKSKRILDSNNVDDRKRMAAFMEESAAAGATGIGHAAGYMGTTRTHIGGGTEAVWGTGNVRAGAPGWVIDAFTRGRARALPAAKVAADLAQMRAGAPVTPPAPGGGQPSVGGVKVLVGVRSRFATEVKDPEIRRLIAASADAEVGGQGSKAEQYYIETVFNRAASRDKSLESTVRDDKYYPASTRNKLGRAVGSRAQALVDGIIANIMAGANESNFATGNESGRVHSGGAPVTRDLGPGKERFVRELPDLGWVKKMEAAAARGDAVA
jgi:hypothetical protein